MAQIVDLQNVVNNLQSAPDKLRAEIGTYYAGGSTPFVGYNEKIANDYYIDDNLDSSDFQVIPTSRARIFFSGQEGEFRDQVQWNEYVSSLVQTGVANLDHQFSFSNEATQEGIQNNFVKNYHNPNYEDFSKQIGSNQLLNWNLISYPFKSSMPALKRISDVVTNFDDENYEVNSGESLTNLFLELRQRYENYSGQIEEVNLKQRHIFDLLDYGNNSGVEPLMNIDLFPYYYVKSLPSQGVYGGTLTTPSNLKFNRMLTNYEKRKNIFQAIKQDLSFSNREFSIDGNATVGKIHNLINLVTSTRILSIQEQTNELFLLPQNETDFNDLSERFVDQVNTVRFLSEMRQFLKDESRDIKKIFDSTPSKTFFVGYKIEKYLDNDAGSPIQTYYTNDLTFYDTQLKYGRKYIYKTKVLIGILGSSYEYSNLFVSQNETMMMGEDGSFATTSPANFNTISNRKYRAYVDVTVSPSFQILEYQIDEDEVAFVDSRTLPPNVEFYNNSKKASVEFFFSPMFAKFQPEEIPNEVNKELLVNPFQSLTEEDQRIQSLLDLSSQETMFDYFTGIYEIYRMESPPVSYTDFENNFLTTVDDRTAMAYPPSMTELPPFELDNMNGYFEDFISPNTKYYYAFRALTYHGTPSNLTFPFEVELLRDSDEYKISVSKYSYPKLSVSERTKNAKRIVMIRPNIERLLFSEIEEEHSPPRYVNGDGRVLSNNIPKKIKIRVTSKHTGKKMDINVNLILKEDDSFTLQN